MDDSRRVRRLALALGVLATLAAVVLLSLSGHEHDDRGNLIVATPATAAADDLVALLPSPTARPAPLEELRAEPEPVVATEPAATAARGGRLEVLVRDEKGAPVAGFALSASHSRRGPSRRDTDSSGRATWEDLAPGRVRVHTDEGLRFDEMNVQPTWVNAAFSVVGESEALVEVAAGSTARHVFEVAHRAQVVVKLDEVRNEAELEELTLADESHDEPRRLHSAIERTLGATQVEWSVAPGKWVLLARWAAASSCWSRPVPLDLQPGERREVTISSLPVQVTWGGRVVDTEGRPVGGVVLAITVREHGGLSPGWPLALLDLLAEKRASSADDGTWALAVPAGATALEVDTANGRGRYLAEYDVDPKVGLPSQPIGIVVTSACILDAAVTLPPAPPSATDDMIDDSTWTLTIRRQTGPSTWAGARRTTPEGGKFTFKRLAAGLYQAELSFGETVCARALQFEVAPGFGEGDRIRVALDFSR